MRTQRGFTLLELLVAIMIFAIMSALAYGALRQALDTREHADKQAQRLAEVQKAMTILSRDIEQAISRPVRDPYSAELPAMQGGGLSSSLLELTRTGWRNPAAFTRSNLQRVSYQLSDSQLLRHSYAQLDRAFDSAPDETPLLGAVKSVTVRFLNVDNQWLQYWPPAGNEDKMQRQLPKALELVIELEDWGSFKRILPVVGN
jgi:general secretion pathway protein J